jgi:hypothetical protein
MRRKNVPANLTDQYWEAMTGEKSVYFAQLENLYFGAFSHSLPEEFDVLVKECVKPPLLASLERLLEEWPEERSSLKESGK